MAYWTHTKDPIGCFTEKEVGNYFEYSHNDEEGGWGGEWPHKIWVGDGYRYGMVMVTRAYVVVDEDDRGEPVVEKWLLKKNRLYAAK
jgi:hypothetical protein